MAPGIQFGWFWTFWHWAEEGYRTGRLLREPLDGLAPHWDEWFNHEAAAADREAILQLTSSSERYAFEDWLKGQWAHRIAGAENKALAAFTLSQLVQVAPFAEWELLESYRFESSEGRGAVQAVILGSGSSGSAEDVRAVSAFLVPPEHPARGGSIAALNFDVEQPELESAREAARSLFAPCGRIRLFARWLATGPRPYSGLVQTILAVGWLVVAALFAFLVFGPDPGPNLRLITILLLGLWLLLVVFEVSVCIAVIVPAWRAAASIEAVLNRDHLRLALSDRLTVQGGSAGLAFVLGIVGAALRSYPDRWRRSWFWRKACVATAAVSGSIAATGVVLENGRIKPVILTGKLRACREHGAIQALLTPRHLAREKGNTLVSVPRGAPAARALPGLTPAYAASERTIVVRKVGHVTHALLAWLKISDAVQMASNAGAAAICVLMLAAAPDLACIAAPPPPPAATAPSSPSPYYLWVSLDTRHPRFFQVVLESQTWSNRRADVIVHRETPASTRAEIRLIRLPHSDTLDFEEGTVWIERRPCLLGRSFEPGERVGQYTMAYLNHLGYD